MKKWLLLISLTMLLNAEDGLKKVVFELTTGDQKKFEQTVLNGIIKNKNHYESKMEELEVAVVIHGDAYKFFIKDLESSPYKDDKELKEAQESFSKRLKSSVEIYKVQYLMCQAGMSNLNIAKESLYDFVTLVPTSTMGLIDKQSEGYAYVPIR